MSIGRDGVGLEPHPAEPTRGAPSAEAVLAWARARDAAVRGLAHALSNRVGTVAAVAGMLGDGAGDAAPPESVVLAARILAGEGERLEALLVLFRAASADPFGPDAAPEPLHVPELLAEVVALAGYAVPDVEVRVDAAPDVRPAVASRAALGQALLTCTCAVGRGEVVLQAASDEADVSVTVALVADPGMSHEPAAAARWLVGGAGGSAVVGGGGVIVTVPALGQ